ncbi:MAG: AI-2E family transporter [Bacillus sp. (in: firmicutes)]
MRKSKFQFWTLQILLIVTIIYVSTKISFVFEPVFILFSTIFAPILISGFLFFLLNPIVKWAERLKLPRGIGILLIFLIFIGLLALAGSFAVPAIVSQVTELVNNIPKYMRDIDTILDDFAQSPFLEWMINQDYVNLEEIGQNVLSYLGALPGNITSSISGIVGAVSNTAIVIVTAPFLLFYMLKDGHKLPNAIVRFLPKDYRDEGKILLEETGKTLTDYIQGQMIVALCVGTLSYIGYLIIDLPYALILALAVAVTNIIPYVGPILGAAPALIVGLFHSPMTALLVVVVALIAQQIESNVISPLVIGKSLDTHPATIIIILLTAGNLAGILGMILAVPVYAVVKTIILNIVKFVQLSRENRSDPPQVEIE